MICPSVTRPKSLSSVVAVRTPATIKTAPARVPFNLRTARECSGGTASIRGGCARVGRSQGGGERQVRRRGPYAAAPPTDDNAASGPLSRTPLDGDLDREDDRLQPLELE